MNKRKLGSLEVSAVGYGCMGLTHAYGSAIARDEAVKIIRETAEVGYTFFDTAECYIGEYEDGTIAYNEDVVGEALAPIRDKVVIASKFGVTHQGTKLVTDSNLAVIRKSVEGSLKRLGVECIDLYYQHRIDPKLKPEIIAEIMKELIKEGKIKHWGISEANEEYLRRAHAVCPVTAIQNRLSMLCRWHLPLVTTCQELNIGFVAFSPIGNGFLSGKYQSSDKFGKDDFRNIMPQYTKEGFEAAKSLLDLVNRLAEEKNSTMAQISLAWVLATGQNVVPIPGSVKISRIKENAQSADVKLSESELKKNQQLARHVEYSRLWRK